MERDRDRTGGTRCAAHASTRSGMRCRGRSKLRNRTSVWFATPDGWGGSGANQGVGGFWLCRCGPRETGTQSPYRTCLLATPGRTHPRPGSGPYPGRGCVRPYDSAWCIVRYVEATRCRHEVRGRGGSGRMIPRKLGTGFSTAGCPARSDARSTRYAAWFAPTPVWQGEYVCTDVDAGSPLHTRSGEPWAAGVWSDG
jgi:hypothetical protein